MLSRTWRINQTTHFTLKMFRFLATKIIYTYVNNFKVSIAMLEKIPLIVVFALVNH